MGGWGGGRRRAAWAEGGQRRGIGAPPASPLLLPPLLPPPPLGCSSRALLFSQPYPRLPCWLPLPPSLRWGCLWGRGAPEGSSADHAGPPRLLWGGSLPLSPLAARASAPAFPPSLPPPQRRVLLQVAKAARAKRAAGRGIQEGHPGEEEEREREGGRGAEGGGDRSPPDTRAGQPASQPRAVRGLAARTTGSQAGSPQEGASEAAAAAAAAAGASATAAAAVAAAAAASVAATAAAAAAARRRGPAGGAAAGLRPPPRGWEWREAGGEAAEARLPLRAREGRPRARSEAAAPRSQPFRRGASGSSGADRREEDARVELRRHFGAPPPLLRPALSSSLSSAGKEDTKAAPEPARSRPADGAPAQRRSPKRTWRGANVTRAKEGREKAKGERDPK